LNVTIWQETLDASLFTIWRTVVTCS